MAARVTLRLERKAAAAVLQAPALLNGGFESGEPCVLLPRVAAARLYPGLEQDTTSETVLTAGGPSTVRTSRDRLEAAVITRDRRGRPVRLRALVSDTETEILVSDSAIDALGVKIESHGRGLWRFADERRIRRSERRRDWPP